MSKRNIYIFIGILAVLFFVWLFNPKSDQNNIQDNSKVVQLYFGNSKLDPDMSCNKVFATERKIPNVPGVAREALEELLAGVTDVEKGDGYFTSINPGVKINNIYIKGGIAFVDLDETLERSVGGSCRVSAIRAQITETLKQFDTVNSVVISVNGRTEDILQP